MFGARVYSRFIYRKYSDFGKKTVVISGCDSGLGYSLAHSCANRGSKVLAGCLDIDGPGAHHLRKLGGVQVHHLDVTDYSTIQSIVHSATKNGDTLQAVVNNAGILVFGEFEWQTTRQLSRQIEVNLIGTLNLTHAFLAKLRADQGRVINVLSHCGLVGLPGLATYGATKAALLNWNDALRIEQAKYGVCVISFTPGSFYGNSNIMANQKKYAEEMLENMEPDQKMFHLEYFKKVHDYLSNLPTSNEPSVIPDEKLLNKLTEAVFSSSPRSSYNYEPLRYSIYHSLFKISPIWIRDILVEHFVNLPRYDNIKK